SADALAALVAAVEDSSWESGDRHERMKGADLEILKQAGPTRGEFRGRLGGLTQQVLADRTTVAESPTRQGGDSPSAAASGQPALIGGESRGIVKDFPSDLQFPCQECKGSLG